MSDSDQNENKPFITTRTHTQDDHLSKLAEIPERMGFKGSPEGKISPTEPQISLEQKLTIQIMMQDPAESIEETFQALVQKTIRLAKGFDRTDVVDLLEPHITNKNKLRPKNPT